jgi:hypothetical protein
VDIGTQLKLSLAIIKKLGLDVDFVRDLLEDSNLLLLDENKLKNILQKVSGYKDTHKNALKGLLQNEDTQGLVLGFAEIILVSPYFIADPNEFVNVVNKFFTKPEVIEYFAEHLEEILYSSSFIDFAASFAKFNIDEQMKILEIIVDCELNNIGSALGYVIKILKQSNVPEQYWLKILEQSDLLYKSDKDLNVILSNVNKLKTSNINAILEFSTNKDTNEYFIKNIGTILGYLPGEIEGALAAKTTDISGGSDAYTNVCSLLDKDFSKKVTGSILGNPKYFSQWENVLRVLTLLKDNDLLADNVELNLEKLLKPAIAEEDRSISPSGVAMIGSALDGVFGGARTGSSVDGGSDGSLADKKGFIVVVSEMVSGCKDTHSKLLEQILQFEDIEPAVRIFQQLLVFSERENEKVKAEEAMAILFSLTLDQQRDVFLCIKVLSLHQNEFLLTADNVLKAIKECQKHPLFSDLQAYDKLFTGAKPLADRDLQAILTLAQREGTESPLSVILEEYKSTNISGDLSSQVGKTYTAATDSASRLTREAANTALKWGRMFTRGTGGDTGQKPADKKSTTKHTPTKGSNGSHND